MIKTRVFPEHNYKGIYFGDKTLRIALDPLKPITELKFPEFYDVKITDFCEGQCPYCYMDSNPQDQHAGSIIGKVNDYFGSMSENEKPFQVAIGGGEPTSHPQFIDSLAAFYNLGITPNYTTNGMFASGNMFKAMDILDATERFCGGVAVSCHEHLDKHWKTAVNMFAERNIKLNLHIIISDPASSIRFRKIYEEYKDIVEYFVLLPYGETGRAEPKAIDWEYMVSVMPEDTSKMAFGANFHPYLVANRGLFDVSLYDPESMSKFLDLMDMKLYPSSFHLEEM